MNKDARNVHDCLQRENDFARGVAHAPDGWATTGRNAAIKCPLTVMIQTSRARLLCGARARRAARSCCGNFRLTLRNERMDLSVLLDPLDLHRLATVLDYLGH